jgi:hypothetical protein
MGEASKELWKKQLGPRKSDVRDAAGNRREAAGGSAEPGAVKYTGNVNEWGVPPNSVMDFARMRQRDRETGKSMLEGHTFYKVGERAIHYW